MSDDFGGSENRLLSPGSFYFSDPTRKTRLGGGIRKGEAFDYSGRNGEFETKRMKQEQDDGKSADSLLSRE